MKASKRVDMQFPKKFFPKINIQRLVVALCTLVVCIGTQQMQTVAWYTGLYELSRDLLGVLMAIIIFTNYKWLDFVKYKIIYITWSILGVALSIFVVPAAIERRADYLAADTVVIAAGIFLMGYCLLHTVITFFVEKNRPVLYRPLFVIWVVMLLLMVFSRSDYIWPECYFVLFLCWYLTPQTSAQRANTVAGLVDGMILAYVFIQGHALLCRPYDRVRYVGNFCNPNNNCVFLCLCLAAILAKILFLTEKKRKKATLIFYFLLAGSCYSLICMTVCRTGYLTVFIMTIFFLTAYCNIRKKKVFLRMGLLMVLIFCITLPLTYAAVRYVPTIHPHVLFYFQEGYSTSRVHSWDERDSEKFVTFRQVLEEVLGRFESLAAPKENTPENPQENISAKPQDGIYVASRSMVAVKLPDAKDNKKQAMLSEEEGKNALLVRYTIYKWFFTHLSLRGMPYAEQGLQLTEHYWVQHAHNIYLDYGINFGYPVMILFAVFIWWGIGRLTMQSVRQRSTEKWACLLFVLIPPVFGFLEFSWGAGMISTVSLYLVFTEFLSECK